MNRGSLPDVDLRLEHALEAYSPAEVAARIETTGVAKASLGVVQTLTLALLAGAYIGIGGLLYLLAMTGADPNVGVDRIVGGAAFSLGLVLVVIAGAELFTGNALVVIAWADGRVASRGLLRNWALVYVGNFAGAIGLVALVWGAGTLDLAGGGLATRAIEAAAAKTALPFTRAFVSGVLCNILVCLAVWMSFSARHVVGKVLCIVFPVTAFIALGFEHSVANMFLIPLGMIAGGGFDGAALANNLVPVTLGNIVGGGVLVAAVYWLIYRQGRRPLP